MPTKRGRVADESCPEAPAAACTAPASAYTAIVARFAPGFEPSLVERRMLAMYGPLDTIEPVFFARAVKLAAERLPPPP